MNLFIRFLYSASAIAVICSIVILTLLWRGHKPDLEIAKLLDATQTKNKSQKTVNLKKTRSLQNSPLVVQAQIYADLLNPPKSIIKDEPISHTPSRTEIPQIQIRPKVTDPKFKVHATSVYRSDFQGRSMALISEPGRGLRWVREGDDLGRLIVHEIKQGIVIYQNGEHLGQVTWEPLEDTDSDSYTRHNKTNRPKNGLAIDSASQKLTLFTPSNTRSQ